MEGFLNPIEVLKQIELKDNMKAADFGCGSGGWVFPLAKILQDGRVHAIDILEEPLSVIQNQMRASGIFNIEIVRSNIEAPHGSKLSDGICDLVLLTNLLFQADDKQKVLEEAKRVLKTGGKVLVVDWKKGQSLGPKEGRVSPGDIKKLAEETGFKTIKEFEASNFHWGLLLEKP